MAKPKQTTTTNVTKQNSVKIVGYLKENNLERIVSKDGKTAIRGSITIAVNEVSSYKVQFFMNALNKDQSENKDYKKLEELLPENTISIASYLKTNESADYKAATTMAAKVYAIARFEEFASRQGEIEKSMVLLKGFRAGFKQLTATDASPFTPEAKFKVDVYVDALTPVEENGETTGKLWVDGLIPTYDNSVNKVGFIAYPDDGIADYISEHYAVSDTVTLIGDLTSVAVRKEAVQEEKPQYFGKVDTPQYETRFIRERRIMAGSTNPIHNGEEGSITTDFVKKAMVLRDNKMDENGKKASTKKAAAPAAAPVNTSAATSVLDEEVDF